MIECAPRYIERERGRIGNVETLDRAGQIESGQEIAGLAGQRTQSLTLGAHYKRQRSPERRIGEGRLPRLIEADEEKAARFQFAHRAREILHEHERYMF